MDNIFALKLFTSFVIGGLWISFLTVMGEKLGPKIGGALGGLPSTTAIALFFIGWTQTPTAAAESTTIIPIILGVDALFVLTYCFVLKYNFYTAIVSSIAVWFILSFCLVVIKFDNFSLSITFFVIFVLISYLILEHILKVKSEHSQTYRYSFTNLLFRALIGGSTISAAVILAKIGGPTLGGVFSSFPANLVSTMMISYFAQGKKFSLAMMKILMITGTINVAIYAISIRYTYKYFGLVTGTSISFILSVVTGYIMYRAIKKLS